MASSTDWQAAFGFTSASVPAASPAVAPPSVDSHIDDDLGMKNQQNAFRNVNKCNVRVKINGNVIYFQYRLVYSIGFLGFFKDILDTFMKKKAIDIWGGGDHIIYTLRIESEMTSK